jgi:hypothetical protein
VIVPAFPSQQGLGCWGKPLEGGATPELFFIDAMTAFHFSVLLRAPRLDIAQLHPRLLNRECEGKREFGAIVDLQFPDGKRERGAERRQEAVAGLLIFPGIEAENSVAGTVINGGVLKTLGASHFHFFDVHLHTVAGPVATEER